MTQSNTGGSPIETETLRRIADGIPVGMICADYTSDHEHPGWYIVPADMVGTLACVRADQHLLAEAFPLLPQLAAEVLALRSREAEMRAALTQINVGDGWAAQIARAALSRPDSGEGRTMDDREHLYSCETCGALIYPGDKYQPGGEFDLCPEHAATLADVINFWEDDIANTSGIACWPDEFDSIEDAQEHLDSLRAQAARDGADFKILYTAGGPHD